ncbi:MAG: ABC transporter permease [Pirellulaceae bacterium]
MRIRQPISLPWRVGLGAASVLLILLLYTWLAATRQSERRRESGPEAQDLSAPSWLMLYQDGLVRACTPQGRFKRKEIWIVSDFKATFGRLAAGLAGGVLVSVILGLLMGCYDPIDAFFLPPFSFVSKVPLVAVVPIFFLLVGVNFYTLFTMIFVAIVPTLAQAISQSVRKDVPEELIYKAHTLGASQFELIWEVVFKQVLPRVLDAVRLNFGPALVLLVATEWFVGGLDEGIGYRLRLFFQRTDMTVVYVYVFILGMIGLVTDYALIWLRRWLCPWFGD